MSYSRRGPRRLHKYASRGGRMPSPSPHYTHDASIDSTPNLLRALLPLPRSASRGGRRTYVRRRAEMPGLKAPARRHTETTRGVVPDADGLIGVKTATFPTAGLSSQERRLLRKRFQSELEVVHGLLKKAELLVAGKSVKGSAAPSKARPAPRRGKEGRFLPAEDRLEATEVDRARAKRRKTIPLVEIIEPRMSQDEREHLAGNLSSLSAELPAHIVEFMQRKCSCDAGLNGGEMEIDLHSTGDAALYELKKLLEEFADVRKQRLEARPESPKDDAEDGELAEEQEEEDMYVDVCGNASPVAVDKVRCSSPLVRKDGELDDDDEFVDICGDASPVAIEKFSEICSSSSGSSSDSSDSDIDSDGDKSVSSSPAPAVLPIGAAARPLELQSNAAQDEKPQLAAPPSGRITDLVARAQEKRSRCRELDRKRAREELQEMERTAMPSDSIRPRDMVLLGIAAVEYVVSSDDETRPVRSMGGKLRLGPGRGSLVQQLGLFLKADYFRGEEEEKDLEEGEHR